MPQMNELLMDALACGGILCGNFLCECEESSKHQGVRTRLVNRRDTVRHCSSSTAGAANWMVINGMEADKYLCERACQGHGSDGRELECLSAHGRERGGEGGMRRELQDRHLFFMVTANPHPFIPSLNS